MKIETFTKANKIRTDINLLSSKLTALRSWMKAPDDPLTVTFVDRNQCQVMMIDTSLYPTIEILNEYEVRLSAKILELEMQFRKL